MVTLPSSTENSELQLSQRDQDAATPSDFRLLDLQLNLIQNLQTSLDPEDVLRLFYSATQSFVPVQGLAYRFEKAHISHKFGIHGEPCAEFIVSDSVDSFGKLSFSREAPFTAAETATLGILTANLFYPLRNALRYQDAVACSMRDPLTRVGNRTALTQALTRELEVARRYQRPLSLILVDIDHFKKVNDTVGHSAGDLALQHLVEKISANLRQIDEVFRYGGEEFVVLLGQTDIEPAMLVAERIRESLIREPLILDDTPLPLTVSIGVSTYQRDDSEDCLFNRADHALYQAKHSGRNCVISCAQSPRHLKS
jgi:diguanylate cyclase (GGDEF)-like protein